MANEIVSGSDDETVRSLGLHCSGTDLLPPFRGHDSRVVCVAFSWDSSKMRVGFENGEPDTIRVWDAAPARILPPL